MKDKEAIRLLHDILQHKYKYYIDFNVLEIEEFDEVALKASQNADYTLPTLSVNALYQRYKAWQSSSPIVNPDRDHFDNFLDAVLYDLGRKSLRGNERTIFEDNYCLRIHFLL
jgi:hypothetical protein